jgi:hypothetical protein
MRIGALGIVEQRALIMKPDETNKHVKRHSPNFKPSLTEGPHLWIGEKD